MKTLRLLSIVPTLLLVACDSSNAEAVAALDEIGDRVFSASRNKNESVVYNAKYYSDDERQIVIFEIGIPNTNGVLESRDVNCWKDLDEPRFDCQTSRQNDSSELGRVYRMRQLLAELYYWGVETDQPSSDKNRIIYEYSDSNLSREYGYRYRQ